MAKCDTDLATCLSKGGCVHTVPCPKCGVGCGYACSADYIDEVFVADEQANGCGGYLPDTGKFVCRPDEDKDSEGAPFCGLDEHCCCGPLTTTMPPPDCIGECSSGELEISVGNGVEVTIWERSGSITAHTVTVADLLAPGGVTIGPTSDDETYTLASDGRFLFIESTQTAGSGGNNIAGAVLSGVAGLGDIYAKKVEDYEWNHGDPDAERDSVCNAVDGDLGTYSRLGAGDTDMKLRFCMPSSACMDRPVDLFFAYHPIDDVNIVTCYLKTNLSGSWDITDWSISITNNSRNSFSVTAVNPGIYAWNVYCINTIGNESYVDGDFNWTFTVCPLLPTCTVTSTEPITNIFEKMPNVTAHVEFDGSIPAWVDYEMEVTPPGGTTFDFDVLTTKAYVYHQPTSDMSIGPHTVNVRAYAGGATLCDDSWEFSICEWVTNVTNGSGLPLDIVFALDTTGSMSGALNTLQSYIETSIDNFVARSSNFRVGYVSFGDCQADGIAKCLHTWEFTNNSVQMKANIVDLNANWRTGGGDARESVADAVYAAVNDLAWNADTARVIFVFTDNPSKPCSYPGQTCTLESAATMAASDDIKVHTMLPSNAHEVYYDTYLSGITGGLVFTDATGPNIPDLIGSTIDDIISNTSVCEPSFSTLPPPPGSTSTTTTTTTTMFNCSRECITNYGAVNGSCDTACNMFESPDGDCSVTEDCCCFPECPTSAGANADVVCEYGLTPPVFIYNYANNIIDVCDPEPPMISTLVDWILSDPGLESLVALGQYDDAFVEISVRVHDDVYGGGARYDPLVDSCVSTSAGTLLSDPFSVGVCLHWSNLVLSLARSLGVPEARVQIWEFETPTIGHAVTAYQSDGGDWWIMDNTCCHMLTTAANWRTNCGDCACIDDGCIARVSDGGIFTRQPAFPFEAGEFKNVCNC